MSVGLLPVLNRNGNWAVYFGGPDILDSLTGDFFWRWNLINSVISSVFQISLLVIKNVKARNLTSLQANMFVMAGNFLNINGILTSIVMMSIYMIFYVLINGDHLKPSPGQSAMPPFCILIITAILLIIQLRPFFCNHSLR